MTNGKKTFQILKNIKNFRELFFSFPQQQGKSWPQFSGNGRRFFDRLPAKRNDHKF